MSKIETFFGKFVNPFIQNVNKLPFATASNTQKTET
jgi:hypothetical protein